MKYTALPTITEKRIIERRFPAWQGCVNPDCLNGMVGGTTETLEQCPHCSGEGGWWHPMVTHIGVDMVLNPTGRFGDTITVTKSSTLVHVGERCSTCLGGKITPCLFDKECDGIDGEGRWEVEDE